MATQKMTVHIQIELEDQHGFKSVPLSVDYVLDHDADEILVQQDAILKAAGRARAEWAAQGNPLSLF